jgi:hypothetical protein
MINNYGQQSDFVVDPEGATPDGGFYAAPAQYDLPRLTGLTNQNLTASRNLILCKCFQ